MPVEAIVMTEMAMMMPGVMPVAVVVATHPGIGIAHAGNDVHRHDPRPVRAPIRAMGHRGRHHKHGSRKQRGGNDPQHGRIPS